jgi:WhiB family redox-sensing transcriptional regulator
VIDLRLAAPAWMRDAACAGMDPGVFFPDPDSHARHHKTVRRHKERAKKVCARCPVARECLEHALANDEEFGIWGGTTPKERRAMVRTGKVVLPARPTPRPRRADRPRKTWRGVICPEHGEFEFRDMQRTLTAKAFVWRCPIDGAILIKESRRT